MVVLFVAGLAWGIAGCGDLIASKGTLGSSLILADSVTGNHFRLTVVDGALTLTQDGGLGTLADPGLTDSATGATYSLAVNNGALMLMPESGMAGAATIGFSDSVTGNAYALAVKRGELSLTPN